jgi:uncharacterized protein YfaA (DUF2138 family)
LTSRLLGALDEKSCSAAFAFGFESKKIKSGDFAPIWNTFPATPTFSVGKTLTFSIAYDVRNYVK